MNKKYFIIDFDSTFVKKEALDELAKICLKNDKEKERKIKKIEEITNLGMSGKIDFEKSLTERLKLINITKTDIEKLVKILKKNVTPSIKRNKEFFKKYKNQIFIVSGGFKEYIIPVVKNYGIEENHVYANSFIFDKTNNKVIGFDKENPMAKKNGKIEVLKKLNLKGEIIAIGDGYTDYQLKEAKTVDKFIAFIENKKREEIIKKADKVAPNFDEFLYENNLPLSLSYPKNRIKVLLLENIDNEAVKNFEKEGYQVEYYPTSFSPEVLKEKIKNVKILGIRSKTIIDKNILTKGEKLLAIGAFCIGTDQIDLETAAQKGIAVFNAPYQNSRSVAEMIIGEIIMLARGIFEKNKKMHQGIWEKSSKDSFEIRGKTLGIIGYGNIGSQVSILAEALGMKVIFYDKVEKLALGNAKKCSSLDELLKNSDIITIHVDGKKENKNLIGEKEFKKMKNNVIFLNASRGFVVDLNALYKNIKNGKIKGAAIDVFPNEPLKNTNNYQSILQNLPNVILTPHIGGSTIEAQRNIANFVSKKIIEFINTGNTDLSVNLPNIQPPPLKNSHRLLHIHKNVPGILAKINSILAKNNINILGQLLKTNEKIGYVITDVNKKYNQKIIKELKNVENTIRFRVLY